MTMSAIPAAQVPSSGHGWFRSITSCWRFRFSQRATNSAYWFAVHDDLSGVMGVTGAIAPQSTTRCRPMWICPPKSIGTTTVNGSMGVAKNRTAARNTPVHVRAKRLRDAMTSSFAAVPLASMGLAATYGGPSLVILTPRRQMYVERHE
jgi:hypothetical protein